MCCVTVVRRALISERFWNFGTRFLNADFCVAVENYAKKSAEETSGKLHFIRTSRTFVSLILCYGLCLKVAAMSRDFDINLKSRTGSKLRKPESGGAVLCQVILLM